MLIAMGIVEMGIGWMTTNDVNAVAHDAARTGTSAPAYLTADRSILRSIGFGLSTKELAGLKKVVIYKASSTTAAVPTGCLSTDPSIGSPGGAKGNSSCNIYGPGGGQLRSGASHRHDLLRRICDFGLRNQQDQLPLVPRDAQPQSGHQLLDYLGVYIEIEHTSLTHFGFGNMTIHRQAVFRLEPKYGGQ